MKLPRSFAAVVASLVVLAVQVAEAQRVITSLGSRLKRFNKNQSLKKSSGRYIVEGEEETDSWSLWSIQSLTSYANENTEESTATAAAAIFVVFCLIPIFVKSKERTEEDDIVIENDHIKAMRGLETVEVGFSGIRMSLKTKKGEKLILDGSIRGRARPGRMLAIMGPSGAGKSTVIHALAGKIKDNSKISLQGNRYVNGDSITGDSMVPSAFVEQDVTFFPHMTVRETLSFRVELKLGSRISKASRDELVNDLIAQMNLETAADTKVGDNKVRGISGGERRRLSIACELISSPSVIFLDEPTSGLDSTAAASLVETLRELADSGKTVIAVIHQPSQHVFSSFDDLLLVAEGQQMYFGEVAKVRAYMEEHACTAPAEMGTAEHILDCISKMELLGGTQEAATKRVQKLADIAAAEDINIGKTDGKTQRYAAGVTGGPKANILVQFKLLLTRSLREAFRGKATLIIKTVQQVSLGLIYGGIYSIGNSQSSIQDRFGLLSLIAIGSSNMAMASTIRSFPKEKAIVSNELGSKLYGTLPYFIGKAISEIPLTCFFNSLFGVLVSAFTGLNGTFLKLKRFLGLNSLHGLASQSAGLVIGAVSPSSDAALALFPAIMVLNIIFDGKNIAEENTPRLLRWIPKIGLIRWGFEGLCLNEFEGLEFDTKGPKRGPPARNGIEALDRFDLGGRSLGDVVRAQTMITSASWFLSYLGLTFTRQKWQYMETPKMKSD